MTEFKGADTSKVDVGNHTFWLHTKNEQALEPKEPIFCPMCRNIQSTTMVFRMNSIGSMMVNGRRVYVCRMVYKCPNCDHVVNFDVPISEVYFTFLLGKIPRGDCTLDNRMFVPPNEQWERESAIIRRRLRDLGYW